MIQHILGILLVIGAVGICPPTVLAGVEPTPFPAYGDGPVEVRLYSNYFCPPCRALEPEIEPLLRDLVDRGVIRLTMVDIPARTEARLYATYLLYALKVENTLERAFAVRKLLNEAAASGQVADEETLARYLLSNGISFKDFDVTLLYPRFNEMLAEDDLRYTPTVVVVVDGERSSYSRRGPILEALRDLKP